MENQSAIQKIALILTLAIIACCFFTLSIFNYKDTEHWRNHHISSPVFLFRTQVFVIDLQTQATVYIDMDLIGEHNLKPEPVRQPWSYTHLTHTEYGMPAGFGAGCLYPVWYRRRCHYRGNRASKAYLVHHYNIFYISESLELTLFYLFILPFISCL